MRIFSAGVCGFAVLGLLVGAGLAFAETKPDFSGVWVLNKTESAYPNPASMPTKLTRSVRHDGSSLEYEVEQVVNGKTVKSDVEVTIGHSAPGDPAVAEWKGSMLNVTLHRKDGAKQLESWSLSADRKRFVNEIVITKADGGEAKIHLVFDRQ
jgi:hypothetical protein